METKERIASIRLARTDHIGPVTFQKLLQIYGTAQAALDALPDISVRGGRKRKLVPASQAEAQKEHARSTELGGRILIWGEADYPAALQPLSDAPPILGAFGDMSLLQKPALAIVGARNASAAAHKVTSQIVEAIGAEIVIVSGLARGIDGTAHHHAITTGTIGIIANGVDITYPKEHKELQHQMMQTGLVLTEHAPGTQPLSAHFPRRNRIISGLSLAVLVVEAARRSGTLITARFAAEQGREVMAVPGSPLDTRCHGSNNLIRDGASLVENGSDVMAVLRPLMNRDAVEARQQRLTPLHPITPPDIDDSQRQSIISLLGPTPIDIDEIIRLSDLPVPVVNLVLIELELAERLTRAPSGGYCLL